MGFELVPLIFTIVGVTVSFTSSKQPSSEGVTVVSAFIFLTEDVRRCCRGCFLICDASPPCFSRRVEPAPRSASYAIYP